MRCEHCGFCIGDKANLKPEEGGNGHCCPNCSQRVTRRTLSTAPRGYGAHARVKG